MRQEELKALFDQQASGYDQQWSRMSPIRDCLHYLLEAVFAELPAEADVLCVGVGTGIELAHLARVFPRWKFTAVDPSGAMLEVCRARAAAEGFAARCHFHEGYVHSLGREAKYHGATCFLVSQFILSPEARSGFFRDIATRLVPGGLLASSDLASDRDSREYEQLLAPWFRMMSQTGMEPEALERMRAAYARDVAVLPPSQVAAIIKSGGFEAPVQFYQAGLIHGWLSRAARSPGS